MEIKKTGTDTVISNGKGSWLSHLEFDGNVLWRIDQDLPNWEPPKEKTSDGLMVLPSDSSKRIDVKPMIEKSWEEAEKNKKELEELQRKDKRLREEANKRREANK